MSRPCAAPGLYQDVEDISVLVDDAPKIMLAAVPNISLIADARPKGSTKMFSRRSLFGGLLAIFAASIAPSEAGARPSIQPNRAPPPPRFERRPAPRDGYVWGPGYWAWRPRRRNYVWRRGHWERDRPGFRYQTPRWVLRSGNWVLEPGGWVR